jgi:NAD(P)-dependent dehydrogenase (short-subunit alcohol dehydrogenase family)
MAHTQDTPWDVHRLPARPGAVFVVTGGNAGIGYFIAEQLATTSATVVIAARDATKAGLAMTAIRARVPGAELRHVLLDLADLGSVETAAGELADLPRLDGLILNAGALTQKRRTETVDGHELNFGTNHLGHFALVARCYPLLARTEGSRVVTMGSLAARLVSPDPDDLESTGDRFRSFRTYGRSKLAQMLFAVELDRRLRAADATVTSVLAHPGTALDSLTPSRPPMRERSGKDRLIAVPVAPFAQSKEHAAWPAVRATLDPAVLGGQLWGPAFLHSRGRPALAKPLRVLADISLANRVWTTTEQATELTVPVASSTH